MNGREPIMGGFCAALLILAIVLPFALGPERAGDLDVHLRHVMPLVGAALLAVAAIRRERAPWLIMGLCLTGIYIALHLIATG
jgi:hypothetical protein